MVDPNLKNKSVLIIDDDKNILSLLAEIIQETGLRSVLASDGTLGMFKAKNEKFHLIITDLNMPKMNGVQFLRTLYEATDAENKAVPVIVISGDFSKYSEELKKYPLVSVLEKPFEAEELVKLVLEKVAPDTEGVGETTGTIKKPTTVERTPFTQGQLIYAEGTLSPDMWMVVEGKLGSFRTAKGREVILLEHLPGEIVGAVAIISKKPSSTGLRALEDSLLVKIPPNNVQGPLATLPKLINKIIVELAQQQSFLIDKVAKLQST